MALTFWLAVSPAQAEDLSWAFDVADAHVQRTKGWPRSDYRIGEGQSGPNYLVVYVRHKTDDDLTRKGTASGGDSVLLFISRRTREVVNELYEQ